MLGTIYTSLSGMNAYRTGLDVISNNVANMNTPGFKLSDPLFRDLVRQYGGAIGSAGSGQSGTGAGVRTDGSVMSFEQGELRDTGNSFDAAVDGAGFFVLELEGERIFTRAGQFELNEEGFLVERGSGARVVVNTDSSAFGHFNVTDERVFPPRTTTEVRLSGVLARGGTSTSYEIPKVTVIDSVGAKRDLKVRFARDAQEPLMWRMEIVDSNNAVVGSGSIRFNDDGTPATDANSLSVTIAAPTGSFDVVFTAGDAGTFGGVTSVQGSTTSQVQLSKQNGVELGSLTKTEFTDRGEIKLTYSNGETRNVARLALARFETPDQMLPLGGSHFAVKNEHDPFYGGALESGLGRVAGGKIELSNVDLTGQFTDLIIVQRGYQASSQVTSVANEMMQQLLAMSSGR